MSTPIVRLHSIELKNFKNVGFGHIDMSRVVKEPDNMYHADILGIYGQNGSGKTAVVEALHLLKRLIAGEKLTEEDEKTITIGENETVLKITLNIDTDTPEYKVDYSVTINRPEKLKEETEENEKTVTDSVYVSGEKLTYKEFVNGEWKPVKTAIEYQYSESEEVLLPKYRWKEATDRSDNISVNFIVAKRLSRRDGTSFIFSKEAGKYFIEALPSNDVFRKIRRTLINYFIDDFFVVKNDCMGVISTNTLAPVSFRQEFPDALFIGTVPIALMRPTVLNCKDFDGLKTIIAEISKVLQTIIPGLQLAIKEYGPQTMKDGNEGVRFEVLSLRNNQLLPLRCESDGIIKIISILQLLMTLYNRESVCVVIDELDSGIYEYLLGEILTVLKDGKGQLIFTSHNLRPLEMIDKSSLIFTTANPQNRYIRFRNKKDHNNLRDMYFRTINLGGQAEELYIPTSTQNIRRAFRKAGGGMNAQE